MYEEQQQQQSQEQQPPQSQEEWEQSWDDYVTGMVSEPPGERPQEQFYEPVAPELDDQRLQREVGNLVAEFPALNDPEIAQAVVTAAQQRAHELGAPEMWRDPRMIRMVFLGEGGEEAFRPQLGFAESIIQAVRGNPTEHRWW